MNRVINAIEHAMRCAVDAVYWVDTIDEQPSELHDRIYQNAAYQALEALSHIHLAQSLYCLLFAHEHNYDRLFTELGLLCSCLLDEIRMQQRPAMALMHLGIIRGLIEGEPFDHPYLPSAFIDDY